MMELAENVKEVEKFAPALAGKETPYYLSSWSGNHPGLAPNSMRQMTSAAVATIVKNCPDFTHFRLCIMNPCQQDYTTNEPLDEAFVAVVKTCNKLQRDLMFPAY